MTFWAWVVAIVLIGAAAFMLHSLINPPPGAN